MWGNCMFMFHEVGPQKFAFPPPPYIKKRFAKILIRLESSEDVVYFGNQKPITDASVRVGEA